MVEVVVVAVVGWWLGCRCGAGRALTVRRRWRRLLLRQAAAMPPADHAGGCRSARAAAHRRAPLLACRRISKRVSMCERALHVRGSVGARARLTVSRGERDGLRRRYPRRRARTIAMSDRPRTSVEDCAQAAWRGGGTDGTIHELGCSVKGSDPALTGSKCSLATCRSGWPHPKARPKKGPPAGASPTGSSGNGQGQWRLGWRQRRAGAGARGDDAGAGAVRSAAAERFCVPSPPEPPARRRLPLLL